MASVLLSTVVYQGLSISSINAFPLFRFLLKSFQLPAVPHIVPRVRPIKPSVGKDEPRREREDKSSPEHDSSVIQIDGCDGISCRQHKEYSQKTNPDASDGPNNRTKPPKMYRTMFELV